jgi:hypothetical protein
MRKLAEQPDVLDLYDIIYDSARKAGEAIMGKELQLWTDDGIFTFFYKYPEGFA